MRMMKGSSELKGLRKVDLVSLSRQCLSFFGILLTELSIATASGLFLDVQGQQTALM